MLNDGHFIGRPDILIHASTVKVLGFADCD